MVSYPLCSQLCYVIQGGCHACCAVFPMSPWTPSDDDDQRASDDDNDDMCITVSCAQPSTSPLPLRTHTNSALTNSALTNSALTNSALTSSALTNSAHTNSALTNSAHTNCAHTNCGTGN